MSRGVLAWTVQIEPSWPVFIAWSMSRAAGVADLADDDAVGAHAQRVACTRSRMVISPRPSMLAGRDSRRITCS